METKTAKILSVQENQKNYNGQSGPVFVHLVKYEGDPEQRAWEYHSLKQQCEKFKVGETTTFDVEIKVNGNYTNYKIKPRQESSGFVGGKAAPKDQGIITALSCLSSASNLYTQSSNNQPEIVLKAAEQFYQWAVNKSTLKP